MRVLIIIAVALASVIGLTYLADSKTITISKDKPETWFSNAIYIKEDVNECQSAGAKGEVYHQYDETLALKDYGTTKKNYWIVLHNQTATLSEYYRFSIEFAVDWLTASKHALNSRLTCWVLKKNSALAD